MDTLQIESTALNIKGYGAFSSGSLNAENG